MGIEHQEIIFEQKKALQIVPLKEGSLFNRLAFVLKEKDNIQLLVSYPLAGISSAVYYRHQAIITSIEELMSGKIGSTTRHEIHHWLLGYYPPSSSFFTAVLNSEKHNFFFNDPLIANYGNYFEFGEFLAYGFELEFIAKNINATKDPLLLKKYKQEWFKTYQKIESFLFETEQVLKDFSLLSKQNKLKVIEENDFVFLDNGKIELKILKNQNSLEQNVENLIHELNLYKAEFKKIRFQENSPNLIEQCRQFKLWMYKIAFNS